MFVHQANVTTSFEINHSLFHQQNICVWSATPIEISYISDVCCHSIRIDWNNSCWRANQLYCNTATIGVKASISRVLDAVIPTALQNILEEGSHQHPLDETMIGGSIDCIENNQRSQVCVGSFYFKDTDNFTVPSPDLNFLGQIKLPMKPPTQIGIDHGGNLIRSFPFNMKADSRTELSWLAKSTRRQSLSMSQRVTSSTSGMQIVYKVANSVKEISSITSTTTSTTVTTNQGDTSYPVTQNSDYSNDDTKSPSAVTDSVC